MRGEPRWYHDDESSFGRVRRVFYFPLFLPLRGEKIETTAKYDLFKEVPP